MHLQLNFPPAPSARARSGNKPSPATCATEVHATILGPRGDQPEAFISEISLTTLPGYGRGVAVLCNRVLIEG